MTLRIRYLSILAIPFSFFILFILLNSEQFRLYPKELSNGIIADLVLTIPFIYYLIIRKTQIPNFTIVPVFVVGVVLGTIFLPKDQQASLSLIKMWVLPLVELGVFAYIFLQFRKIKKSVSAKTENGLDLYMALKKASAEIMPQKLSIFFATEFAVFYYALFKWKTPSQKHMEYTSYRESGTRAILYALLGVVLIETAVLHFLIERLSEAAAWVLTILSIYTGFQILGFVKSLSYRPIQLENDHLNLKYGLFAETIIDLNNIEKLENLTWKSEVGKSTTTLSPLGDLGTYNLVIHVKRPQLLTGFYGKQTTYEKLAIYVDNKEAFLTKITLPKS